MAMVKKRRWRCSDCTFLNSYSRSRCEICHNPQSKSSSMSLDGNDDDGDDRAGNKNNTSNQINVDVDVDDDVKIDVDVDDDDDVDDDVDIDIRSRTKRKRSPPQQRQRRSVAVIDLVNSLNNEYASTESARKKKRARARYNSGSRSSSSSSSRSTHGVATSTSRSDSGSGSSDGGGNENENGNDGGVRDEASDLNLWREQSRRLTPIDGTRKKTSRGRESGNGIHDDGGKNESWRKKERSHHHHHHGHDGDDSTTSSTRSSSSSYNDSSPERIVADNNHIPARKKKHVWTREKGVDAENKSFKTIRSTGTSSSTTTCNNASIPASTNHLNANERKERPKMDVVYLDDSDDSDESAMIMTMMEVMEPSSKKKNMKIASTAVATDATQTKPAAHRKNQRSQILEPKTTKMEKKIAMNSSASASTSTSTSTCTTTRKKMVQQTLFGKIVQEIKDTDVSKLPNQPLEYSNKTTKHSLKRRRDDDDHDIGGTMTSNRGTKEDPRCSGGFFSSVASTVNAADHSPSSPARTLEQNYRRALEILKQTFKISSLRALQPKAIRTALAQKSQIIVMATGGGKSLCYQLPALVFTGVTIVISPLIALMVDQVRGLLQKGVEAAMISSSNSAKENQMIMQRLLGKNLGPSKSSTRSKTKGVPTTTTTTTAPTTKPLKIVYCTPELVQTNKFRAVLTHLYERNQLASIAIDEAHCLSTWGHDFRPAYRQLSWLRMSFPTVPCLAATATATPRVIEDIKEVLRFGRDEKCWKSTFNRENIKYEVRYKDAMGEEGALKDLVTTIRRQHQKAEQDGAACSGIVYVHKRDATMTISKVLQKAGISAAPYHGGMKDADRKRMQKDWTEGKVKVAIATVAFGMGIDLAHVRYVMHWHMSKTIESFYQESGRAGRDGKPSISVLYYSQDDVSKFAYVIKKEMERKQEKARREKGNWKPPADQNRDLDALYKMADYTSSCCRRKFLLQHFGEDIDPIKVCKKTCDFCIDPKRVDREKNKSSVAKAVRDVKRQQHRFGQNYTYSKPRNAFGEFDEGDYDNGDAYEDDNDTYYGSDLGITAYNPSGSKIAQDAQSSGFTSAKSILQHYETLECGANGKKNGFVKFKARNSGQMIENSEAKDKGKGTSFNIPSHLINQVQAKSVKKKKITPQKTSKQISHEADKVRAQIEEIRRKKEALMAKMRKSTA